MGYINEALIYLFNLVRSVVTFAIKNPNYNYGLTIILFTIIIRALMIPLNVKQMKSQSKMQELQPKMKELQNKYKNDPQKQQAEMMKLYKEHNASPFGGCLPILIQMPIFFAMYSIVYHLKGIEGVHFLWLKDLSKPDQFYILPILSAATTYFSTLLLMPKDDSPTAKTTSTMNTAMALVFGFMALNFRSALVLYWVASNLFQLSQTIVMKKLGIIGGRKNDDGIESSKDVVKEVSTDKISSRKKKNK